MGRIQIQKPIIIVKKKGALSGRRSRFWFSSNHKFHKQPQRFRHCAMFPHNSSETYI